LRGYLTAFLEASSSYTLQGLDLSMNLYESSCTTGIARVVDGRGFFMVLHDLAPAGAAAAALEGGALASPSASPRLPVVGVGNPVAVQGLAR
jgi:hypothetical protein